MERRCWYCHGEAFDDREDFRNVCVNVGPKTWMEAKTVRDGFVVPMCVDCSREWRSAMLNLGQMLRARRSELERDDPDDEEAEDATD